VHVAPQDDSNNRDIGTSRRNQRARGESINIAMQHKFCRIIFYFEPEIWMDATDRKILSILQDDASLSIAEVAARVNLSQTPCWRRIQKMDEAGIIQRRVALVDPEALGLGLTVFVEIETGDHSKGWLERFAGAVASMPEVMGFYRMAGDVDYLLQVTVANMAAFDAFYQRLIELVPLKNVTSRFAMERVKCTTAYPVTAE
jgi:Lrp/AsnC family transcriptional regulator